MMHAMKIFTRPVIGGGSFKLTKAPYHCTCLAMKSFKKFSKGKRVSHVFFCNVVDVNKSLPINLAKPPPYMNVQLAYFICQSLVKIISL